MKPEKYQREFESSAIDKELVKLNIGAVDLSWTFYNDSENEDIEFILERLNWNTSRKNDGRLRDGTINSILKLEGGWHITPFWGLADRQTSDYFRFKPDCPPPDPKKNGKPKKYLGAVSNPVRLYTPNIPRSIWAIIAKRYPDGGIPEADFWEWILNHPEVPVIITEGEKKALSGLSAGYATVSLPGIDCGYKSVFDADGEGKHLELIPDLVALAEGGRTIQIAFDRDTNPKTIRRVAQSRQKLAMLFGELGCETFTINWGDEYKGFDDFIANSKPKTVADSIAAAVNISPTAKVEKEKLTALYSFSSSIERGLDLVTISEDGEEQRESIGNHLQAIAYVNNPEQDGAALLLEFQTIRGGVRRWTIPRAELAGDGAVILGGLLGRDYSFKRRQKQLLLDYLHGLGNHVEETFTVTDSSGWVGKSFVMPHQTDGDERLKFRDVDVSPEAITEIKGTLHGWKDGVAARCAGNSRLILGLGTSFAAPLLPIIDVESGGFHLVGETSKGKTTILSVAASVTGVKDIPHWRTTTNGLESTATAFNHLCLPLDEIAQKCFMGWMSAVTEVTEGELLNIDGKTLRGAKEAGNSRSLIHMVSVWSASQHLVLGQTKVSEKSNEITAIPPLLEMLSIRGCLVSIDAMGCQTEIAKTIIEQGGDYVLALKGNQGDLHTDVAQLCTAARKQNFRNIEHQFYSVESKGHGRIETRRYWTMGNTEYLIGAHKWSGLKSIGMVESQREIGGKISSEQRDYILSIESDVQRFATAVRSHWSIENQLHWILDVGFAEDASQSCQGSSAENLAVIRHVGMNLLSRDKKTKVGVKTKRLKAGWNDNYLKTVLSALNIVTA